MMKSFTQDDMKDLIWWLEVIVNAPQDEFIDRYLELEEIVPMAILDRALARLNVVVKSRFDKLIDLGLQGEFAND